MSDEGREILLAGQKKAIDLLATSTSAAARVIGEAEGEAVSLLLEQQKQAEDRLRTQEE